MIVVTGATGFLGNALTRRLVDALGNEPDALKPPVRALVRGQSDLSSLAGLEVEFVQGDIGDLDSLVQAFSGAEGVFHMAGIVDITGYKPDRLHTVNVQGTKNVIEACKRAGVGRLVYASSIHAFVEAPLGTTADEGLPLDPSRINDPYGKTKAEATQLVLAAVRAGLDAVVVHPTGVLGPYDFRPSPTGQAILDYAQRKLGIYVDGGYNFVDVRDVAEGTLAAYAKGRTGENYILSGHPVTVRQLLETIETVSGVPAPRMRLNFGIARALSRLMPIYYWITQEQPVFTTYSLDVLRSNSSISHAKAEAELGYSPRPFRETIEDTIEWFADQRMLDLVPSPAAPTLA